MIAHQETILSKFFHLSNQMMGVVEVVDQQIRCLIRNEASRDFFTPSNGLSEEKLGVWLSKLKSSQESGSAVSFEYALMSDEPHPSQQVYRIQVSHLGVSENGHPMFSYCATDITDHRAEEKRRLETEALYRLIVETAYEGICITNPQGKIQFVNRNTSILTGYSVRELIGKSAEDIVSPEWRPVLQEGLRRRKQGRRESYDLQIRTKDGKKRHVIVSASPLYDGQGKHLGSLTMSTDVTERHEAIAKLMESEERLQLALEGSRDGMWDWNLVTSEIHYSPRWATMLGYEPWEIDQGVHCWVGLMHPDDLQHLRKALDEHFKSGEGTFEHEFRMKRKSGEWAWILTRGKLTGRDPETGRALRLVGTNTDITETKALQARIENENMRLKQMVEHLPVGAVYVAKDEFMINRAVEEVTGWSRDEIANLRDWFTCLYGDEAAGAQLRYQQDREAFFSQPLAHTIRRKNGEVRHVKLMGYRDQHSEIWIVLDMTDLVQMQAEMAQTYKMASLGEMAAGLAHEINNPLAIIKGRAQRLQDRLENALAGNSDIDLKFLETSLTSITMTTDRIAKIIHGLRAFARDSSDEGFTSSRLEDVLEDTLSLCAERFRGGGVRLELDCPDELPALICRPIQISQVLLNLLNNAFDAVHDTSNPWVKITVAFDSDRYEISVTDSGPGVPESIRDKILQPFFSTKAVGKGMGLGLSISRGLMESHGGRLWLDTLCGTTRFCISLPIGRASIGRSA